MITLTIVIIIIIIISSSNSQNTNSQRSNNNNIAPPIPYDSSNQLNNQGDGKLLKFNMYQRKNYLMTDTEEKFYKILINNLPNYDIFAQVNLERIIYCKTRSYSYRNRIKSCSIDFVITRKDNCKIICCIELDDYTHNYKDRIERDKFINRLFYSVGLPLLRINVAPSYDIDKIKEMIEFNNSIISNNNMNK